MNQTSFASLVVPVLPATGTLKFTVEEFMTWIVHLTDKNQKEQHNANMQKAKAKSRR